PVRWVQACVPRRSVCRRPGEVLDLPGLGCPGHVVVPDRSGDGATERLRVEPAVDRGVEHRGLALGVTHPDSGGRLRNIADEPGVVVVVTRPRLPSCWAPGKFC